MQAANTPSLIRALHGISYTYMDIVLKANYDDANPLMSPKQQMMEQIGNLMVALLEGGE